MTTPMKSNAPATGDGEGIVEKSLGLAFWLSVVWLAGLALAALAAPWLPLADPDALSSSGRAGLFSDGHLLGSDALGRDTLARTVWGARISLGVGFVGIVLGLVVGGTLGIISGYFRGVVDQIISFLFFSLLSFPSLVLALLITAAINRSFFTVAMTLGILGIAPIGRLARATTIQFSEREFVQAARVLGARNGRIIVRELLPNVLIPMGALTLLGMGISIVAEGSLAFLGLSVEGGAISWGKSIVDGSQARDLTENAHVALVPIAAMFLTVLALNFAGDRLREYTDVKESAF